MADVSVGGLRLHVQRLGPADGAPGADRAPVLFVHGLVMDNLASWFFTVANPVATGRPVLLYDLRGHGRSERPSAGFGLDALVAELFGVLDAVAVTEPVYLVGHSFGGLLSVAAALTRPERCKGLVLVDGLLPEPGWGASMAATLRLAGAERDEAIATRFQAWLGRHSARKRNRLADQARGLVEQTTLVDDVVGSRSWPDEAYAALQMPIYALYGAESDVRHHGERFAARAPRCELALLPGCSHSLMWEQTATVRDRVVAWLEAAP